MAARSASSLPTYFGGVKGFGFAGTSTFQSWTDQPSIELGTWDSAEAETP